MSKFLGRLALTFLTFWILFECVLRLFSMAGHTVPEQNMDNDKLLKPLANGYWVKGGCKEIYSHYQINEQGWNSLRNYDRDNQDSSLVKIAIVGDSYVEGFHTDVDASIGRQLEQELGPGYAIHEFGRSGGNIEDFSRVYEKYNLDKYALVFVLASYKDLVAKKPAFMTQGKKIPKVSLARTLYDQSAVLRYLNINHGMNEAFKSLLHGPASDNAASNVKKETINFLALKRFKLNTVFLYEDQKMSTEDLSSLPFPTIEIQHTLQPYNNGFDGHWNVNGRKNCAEAIAGYIRSK